MFSKQLCLQLVFFQIILSVHNDNFLDASTTQSPPECENVGIQNFMNRIEEKFLQLEERVGQKDEKLNENQKELMNEITKLKESQTILENKIIQRMEQETLKLQEKLILEQKKMMEESLIKIQNLLVEWEKKQEQHIKSLENLWNEKNPTCARNSSNRKVFRLPEDCHEVQTRGFKRSGIYTIQPDPTKEGFKVWCDMETKGGGWIYIVRSSNYDQNFNLSWSDYKKGFGNLRNEFWIGLDNLYILTGDNPRELVIESVDDNQNQINGHYKQFGIGNEHERYRIKGTQEVSSNRDSSQYEGYGGYGGYGGFKSYGYSGYGYGQNNERCFSSFLKKGNKFSTYDRPLETVRNCAATIGGGFWYGNGDCKNFCYPQVTSQGFGTVDAYPFGKGLFKMMIR